MDGGVIGSHITSFMALWIEMDVELQDSVKSNDGYVGIVQWFQCCGLRDYDSRHSQGSGKRSTVPHIYNYAGNSNWYVLVRVSSIFLFSTNAHL